MFCVNCLHFSKRIYQPGSVVTRCLAVASARHQQANHCQTTDTGPDAEQETRHTSTPDNVESDVRERVLKSALSFVSWHGWSTASLAAGADIEGLPSIAHGMFPRGGVELALYFYESSNEKLINSLKEQQERSSSEDNQPTKNTVTYVADAMEMRLRMLIPYLSSWPQAMVLMSLPQNVPDAFHNLTYLVNSVWYYAGDRSVDMNWYTKRAGLIAAYKSSEVYMLQDKSHDFQDTWKFLHRRLKNFSELAKFVRKVQGAGDTVSSNNIMAALQVTRNLLGINDRVR